MAMMKSGLNTFLVFLIILLLGGMIGISLYFQNVIKVANDKYNNKTATLEKTQKDLEMKMMNLNNLSSSYENLNSDMQSYTVEFQSVYSMCNNEKNALATELNKTKEDLKNKNEVLAQLKTDTGFVNSKVGTAQTEEAILTEKTDDAKAYAVSIRSKVSNNVKKNITITECKSVLSSIGSTTDDLQETIGSIESADTNLKKYLLEADTRLDEVIALLKTY